MTMLADKYVLVTGATGGFGREMVKSFLAEGSKLILTDLKKEILDSQFNSISEGLKEKVILKFEADLSTAEGCEKTFNEVNSRGIKLDIIVNNAGIASVGHFLNTPSSYWEKLLAVNLNAPIKLTNLFLPEMIKQNSGHIVFVSSVAGHVPAAGLATYCASKFGLRAFGEALSQELNHTGIKVTNLYPFFSKTEMLSKSPQFGYSEKRGIPDFLVSKPEDVVRDLINGIKHNELHVFPGPIARITELLNRYTPDIFKSVSSNFLG